MTDLRPLATLHIHLRSGQSFAWDLERRVAEDMRDRIRHYWQAPAEMDGRDAAFGEHHELDTWVRLDAIDAVQLYPVTPAERST